MSRLFHAFSGRIYHYNTIYEKFYDQAKLKVTHTIGSSTPEINSPKEFLLVAVAHHVGIGSIHFLFNPDVPNSLIKHIKKMDTDDFIQIYRIVIQYYLYFCLINNEKLRPEIDKELVLKDICKLIEVDNDNFNKFCTYMDKWEDFSKKPISQWDPFASIAMSMGTKWSEKTATHIFAAIATAIKQTRDLEKPFNTYVDILEYRN